MSTLPCFHPFIQCFLHCILQHPFSSNVHPPCHLHYHGVHLHSLAPNLLPCDHCPIEHQRVFFFKLIVLRAFHFYGMVMLLPYYLNFLVFIRCLHGTKNVTITYPIPCATIYPHYFFLGHVFSYLVNNNKSILHQTYHVHL